MSAFRCDLGSSDGANVPLSVNDSVMAHAAIEGARSARAAPLRLRKAAKVPLLRSHLFPLTAEDVRDVFEDHIETWH